jgi:peptidoglycan hydrolase CwlO-like protein
LNFQAREGDVREAKTEKEKRQKEDFHLRPCRGDGRFDAPVAAEQPAALRRRVSQADIDKLKKNAASLAAQKDQLEDRIAELKDDKSQALAQKRALDQQNAIIEQEIENTTEQIAAYTALVEEETVKLADAQAREEEQYDLFLRRVRIMEETGTVTYLSVLFGATSFSDLLDRAGAIGEVMDYDTAVRAQLIATREEIANTKTDLETTRAGLNDAKDDLDAKQAELETKLTQAQNLIVKINSQQEEYADAIAELDEQEAQVAKEIDRLIEELQKQQNQVVGESGYCGPWRVLLHKLHLRLPHPPGHRAEEQLPPGRGHSGSPEHQGAGRPYRHGHPLGIRLLLRELYRSQPREQRGHPLRPSQFPRGEGGGRGEAGAGHRVRGNDRPLDREPPPLRGADQGRI